MHVPTEADDPDGLEDTEFAQLVDDAFEARAWLARARVVAVANVALATGLENGDSIDGVTLATGDVVLLAGQSTTNQNGLYVVVASGASSRHPKFATYNNIAGVQVAVMEGTVYADTLWRCTSDKGGTIDSTAIAFTEIVPQVGVIAPSQITADQNDYSPTGLAGANELRLSSDASRNITGLTGGRVGRHLIIHNIGSQNIVLSDENGSSTAANRFALSGDITIGPDVSIQLKYDATSSRWRVVSLIPGSISAATQAEEEAASSTTVYTSPGRQHFHPGVAKSWVLFNGTGTPAVTVSYGTTSITDNGNGDWTVNWSVTYSSANYAAFASAGATSGGGSLLTTLDRNAAGASQVARTATTIRVSSYDFAGSATDSPRYSVVGYGDF